MADSPQRFKNFFGGGHSFDRVILPETITMLERFEMFMPTRYPDGFWDKERTKIKWAIGFGHNEGGDVEPKVIPANMVVTLEEARAILALDIEAKAKWVNTNITIPLTSYMYGAIVSLVYQYGQGRVKRESKLVELLNNGDYVDGALEILNMNKRKDGVPTAGHTIRRAIEVAHYSTKVQ